MTNEGNGHKMPCFSVASLEARKTARYNFKFGRFIFQTYFVPFIPQYEMQKTVLDK